MNGVHDGVQAGWGPAHIGYEEGVLQLLLKQGT
jgi:hypothetical protein